MDLNIAGKTAFVAASTGGLGRAVAEALGREGANVAVVGRRGELAREIAAALPSAVGIEADLTTDEGIDAALAQAGEAFGDVDILVTNGPGPAPGPANALSAEGLTQAFDLLVRPSHRLISQTLPGMRARKWGRIVAIGSSGVVAPLPNLATSNTGRAALAGYLKTLAAEVAADSVTVNMVLPGRIATDRVAQLDGAAAERTGLDVEQVRENARKSIPAGRYGRPEEFGAAAAFLCGEQASYITGIALRCDGGLVGHL